MGTTDGSVWWKHAFGLPPALVRWQERHGDRPKRADRSLLAVLALIAWQVAILASTEADHRPLRAAVAAFGVVVLLAALATRRRAR